MENNKNQNQCKEKDLNPLQLYLIATGLSNCRSHYNNSQAEEAYKYYMAKDPKEIEFIWGYLDDRIKVEYIKANLDSVFSFLVNK